MNANGSGEGLNDRTAAVPVGGNPGTTIGEQRLIAAQYAAALWSATLGNQVPISIRTEFTDLDCSGGTAVLGASGPTALYDGSRYPAALANERAGRDLDPGREEIDARFNARVGRLRLRRHPLVHRPGQRRARRASPTCPRCSSTSSRTGWASSSRRPRSATGPSTTRAASSSRSSPRPTTTRPSGGPWA